MKTPLHDTRIIPSHLSRLWDKTHTLTRSRARILCASNLSIARVHTHDLNCWNKHAHSLQSLQSTDPKKQAYYNMVDRAHKRKQKELDRKLKLKEQQLIFKQQEQERLKSQREERFKLKQEELRLKQEIQQQKLQIRQQELERKQKTNTVDQAEKERAEREKANIKWNDDLVSRVEKAKKRWSQAVVDAYKRLRVPLPRHLMTHELRCQLTIPELLRAAYGDPATDPIALKEARQVYTFFTEEQTIEYFSPTDDDDDDDDDEETGININIDINNDEEADIIGKPRKRVEAPDIEV